MVNRTMRARDTETDDSCRPQWAIQCYSHRLTMGGRPSPRRQRAGVAPSSGTLSLDEFAAV